MKGRSISQDTAGAYLCRRPEVSTVFQINPIPIPRCFHAGEMIKFSFSCQYGKVITLVLDFRQRVVAFACGMVDENTLFFFKKIAEVTEVKVKWSYMGDSTNLYLPSAFCSTPLLCISTWFFFYVLTLWGLS